MKTDSNNYTEIFIENSHKGCSLNKEELMQSQKCGCFYCEQVYSPSEITEWIDENYANGESAVCPKCGIDSVLSEKYPIEDADYLKTMNHYWF